MATQSTTWLQIETLYFDRYPTHRGWWASAYNWKEFTRYYHLMELENTVLAAADNAECPHFYSYFCILLFAFPTSHPARQHKARRFCRQCCFDVKPLHCTQAATPVNSHCRSAILLFFRACCTIRCKSHLVGMTRYIKTVLAPPKTLLSHANTVSMSPNRPMIIFKSVSSTNGHVTQCRSAVDGTHIRMVCSTKCCLNST
jgi:hypothetical protein